jgi:subtilisin family serine protease
MADEDLLLRRGGRLIPLKRHPTRFTVIAPLGAETDMALSHLKDLKPRELLSTSQRSGGLFRMEAAETDRERAMAQVRAALPTAIIYDAYLGVQYSAAVFYLTDTIIIELQEFSQEAFQDLLGQYDLADLGTLGGLPPTWRVVRVPRHPEANPITISNRLARDRRVRSAEPNLVDRLYGYQARDQTAPAPQQVADDYNELLYLWHLTPEWAYHKLDHIDPTSTVEVAPGVWDLDNVTGANTVVSVIDVDFGQGPPDLVGKYTNNASEWPSLAAPLKTFPDHGTCCVGLLAGDRNQAGSVGVAPDSKVFAIRLPAPDTDIVKATFDDATLTTAIATAAAKASIASMSLSWPPGAAGPNDSFYAAIASGYNNGQKGGCLYFFAAGNDGLPLGIDPPADAPHQITVVHSDGSEEVQSIYHALDDRLLKTPGVVVVGASTSKAKHARYSNWGDGIGLAAPSGACLDDQGSVDGAQPTVSVALRPGVAEYPFSGTSAATPIAAGVAALVLSANPDLSPQDVREILEDTADQIGPAGQPGDANANYSLSGRTRKRSMYFGYGKVNGKAAVAEALRRRQPHP